MQEDNVQAQETEKMRAKSAMSRVKRLIGVLSQLASSCDDNLAV